MSIKLLQASKIVESFISELEKVKDDRGKNKSKEIIDVMMTGLACMYFQSKSIIKFHQKHGEKEAARRNTRNLFKVKELPAANSMTRILDGLDTTEAFRGMHKKLKKLLDRGKVLNQYRFLGKHHLLSVDGVQYYQSEKVSCKCCLKRGTKKSPYYAHQSLQGAIVHPDMKQILPTLPEEICMQDGGAKEDSEVSAFKRYMANIKKDHPRSSFVINGDALYACNGVIDCINEAGHKYIITVKSSANSQTNKSPDQLYTSVLESIKNDDLVKTDVEYNQKEKGIVYWVNDVTLFKGTGKKCNYFEIFKYNTKEEKYKIVSRHITDITITKENIQEIARGARCRWKIENEGFNVLKNHGYDIEHSYGHGVRASFTYYRLVILAFTMHQIHNLISQLYRYIRHKSHGLVEAWKDIKMHFESFQYSDLQDIWSHVAEGFDKSKPPPVFVARG